jgi:hypothetical protein
VKRLRIDYDWQGFKGRDAPEINATFASLRISFGDRVVTRVFDRTAKTIREQIAVPLYPLAEWLVAHWWLLLVESEVPGRGIAPDSFRQRHVLRSASEGFPLPELRILPQGPIARMEWRPYKSPYATVEFLDRGATVVHVDQARQEFSKLIEAVVRRLENEGVADTWLQTEWAAVHETLPEEREFCSAVAALGLDPYQIDQDTGDELIVLWNSLPEQLRHDVFLAAPPDRVRQTVEWAHHGIQVIADAAGRSQSWEELRHLVRYVPSRFEPWKKGYDLAREVRRLVGAPDTVPLALEQLAPEAIPLLPAEPAPGRSVDGIFGVANSRCLCCYTAKRREVSKRFVVARGLADFFAGRLDKPVFLSAAETQRQQLGRAFAAELLAPARLIRERLSGELITPDEIDDLALDFQVSPYVIEHQIENHRLAAMDNAGH